MTKNIVVFASGGGSNFQAILDAVHKKKLNAEIAGLITSRHGTGAEKKAREAGVPVSVIPAKAFDSDEAFQSALLQQLEEWNPDVIVLAGYLSKIPPSVIRRWKGKILNIHPSLLPKYGGQGFYGIHVHEAVIKNSEKESGCSVHIVTENYDEGPVLARRKVPVNEDDTPETLAARVLEQEHQLYPEVIRDFLSKSDFSN